MMFESSEQISGKSFQSSDAVSNPAFEISEEIVDKLLDKLSSDDEFRAVFLRSPREALASIGHEAAASASDRDNGIWVSFKCEKLASRETILETRNKIRMDLHTAMVKPHPITLNIAKKSG